MIKLVIFDIDGTIVDAYDSIHEALLRTLKDLDYPEHSYEESKRAVGHGVERLLGTFVIEEDIAQALELYTKHTQAVLESTLKFLPGAESLIKGLHNEGYKLAIASNRPFQFSKLILECLKVDQYFDEIVCADNVEFAKPEPDMILEILGRLGLEPQDALYVGDMTVDVETGHNAGVLTVAVPTGSSTREEIMATRPFKLIESLSEIGAILDDLEVA